MSAKADFLERVLANSDDPEDLRSGTDWSSFEKYELGETAKALLIGREAALEIAIRYGGIEGAHHKTWVIDQMVRALTGDDYERTIADACDGEDGPDTYIWYVGIAP